MKSAIFSIIVLSIASLAAACEDSELDPLPTASAVIPTGSSASPSPSPNSPVGPTPFPSHLLPTQTVAAGPRLYEQSAFGYSYEIPIGWFAHGNYSGYCAITTFEPGSLPPLDLLPPGQYKIEIYVSESEGKELEAWLAERDEILAISPDQVDQREEIVVAGVPGITRRTNDEGYLWREYWFASGAHIFTIWGRAGESEVESALDSIVGSFQLDPQQYR